MSFFVNGHQDSVLGCCVFDHERHVSVAFCLCPGAAILEPLAACLEWKGRSKKGTYFSYVDVFLLKYDVFSPHDLFNLAYISYGIKVPWTLALITNWF